MNRVALYVRVSTLGQEEDGYSIDEQIDRLTKYCESRGWIVADVFKDSITGSHMNRPGLQSLVRKAKNYNTVVVYKLDRLSRSQKEVLYLIEDVFEKNGVDFVSLMENFDTSTPFGKAMIGMLAVFAQLEREQIRERMRMGKVGRAKAGKPTNWTTPPFGYDYVDKALIKNELEANIVKYIFNAYLSGKSTTQIIDILNAEGHIGKKSGWTYVALRYVLKNRTYLGKVKHLGELYEGNHEAFITEEVFNKTQVEIQRRQEEAYKQQGGITRPFQTKYLLSGMLHCGCCGSTFGLIAGKLRKDGTRKLKYRCYSRSSSKTNRDMRKNPNGCDNDIHVLVDLENEVWAEIIKLKLDPDGFTVEDTNDNSNEIQALNSELDNIDAKLERLTILFIDGSYPIELLNTQKSQLELQREGIATKLAKLAVPTPALKMEELHEILTSIPKNPSYDYKKRIIRSLIEKITLDGEHMRIHWRFV